jgi:hypothetical protein
MLLCLPACQYVFACLPRCKQECLPACLPMCDCLPGYLTECLTACLSDCQECACLPGVTACLPVCLPASGCLPASMPAACQFSCLLLAMLPVRLPALSSMFYPPDRIIWEGQGQAYRQRVCIPSLSQRGSSPIFSRKNMGNIIPPLPG